MHEISYYYKRNPKLSPYHSFYCIYLEYPMGVGTAAGLDAAYQDWRTYRTFDYNKDKMLYPIPYQEILTNAEIGPEDQNPGY